jgi:predicted nucleic acid-binding protein
MQILADTSIWIGHLRKGNSLLTTFLEEGAVLMHPCVRCELALGCLKNRSTILSFLTALPQAEVASESEVLHVVEIKKLWSLGIGWVDAQLLGATLLTKDCSLWTTDGALKTASERAGAKIFHGAV